MAMAECFNSSVRRKEDSSQDVATRDLCLAQEICRLPTSSASSRRAQGYLFNLLVMVTRKPFKLELADNRSSNGLIDGLVEILEAFCSRKLGQCADSYTWEAEGHIPFVPDLGKAAKQDIAACYCALRILIALSTDERNRFRVLFRKGLLATLTSFLSISQLHTTFVHAILEALSLASTMVPAFNDAEFAIPVLQALLLVLERASGKEEKTKKDRLEFCDNRAVESAMGILLTFSREWEVGELDISRFLSILGNLLNSQAMIKMSALLSKLARTLASAYPSHASEHSIFFSGVMQLFNTRECVDDAIEALKVMHAECPLHQYAAELRKLGRWHILSPAQMRSITALVADLFTSNKHLEGIHDFNKELLGTLEEVVNPLGHCKNRSHLKNGEVENASILDSIFGDLS